MLRIFQYIKKFLLLDVNKFVGAILGISCLLQINNLWKNRAAILAVAQNIVDLPVILGHFVYIFYLVIASSILLLANKPRKKYSKIGPKLISLLASFLPYLLIFAPETRLLRVPEKWGILLLLIGFIISTMGLLSLRKSFSITPEVRGLVVSGLYSFIRHPMYLGSFISLAGIVLLRLSIFSLLVYFIWIVIQVWRSRLEEQLLIAEYPDYKEYVKKTSAFFPLPKIRR